jgi:hypothetical protein
MTWANTAPKKNISAPQIRHIYGAARNLGMDDELLHSLVYSITGKEHIKSLTMSEAISVIDKLKVDKTPEKNKQQKKTKVQDDKPRAGMASTAQIKKIYKLMYELKSFDIGDKPTASINTRLRGVLKKYNKIDDVRFLTSQEAWKVIEELKNMVSNESTKRIRKDDKNAKSNTRN